MRGDYEWEPTPSPGWGVGSILNAFNWDHVRAEVERESLARIALVGLRGAGKSSLVNHLRGWEVSPVGNEDDNSSGAPEDLGLFVLVDLPDDGPAVTAWPVTHNSLYGGMLAGYGEVAWTTLAEADLIVFVLDGGRLLSDSEIVVNQMRGLFSVRSPALKRLHRRACALARAIPRVTFNHISREQNRLADALAVEALWSVSPWSATMTNEQ